VARALLVLLKHTRCAVFYKDILYLRRGVEPEAMNEQQSIALAGAAGTYSEQMITERKRSACLDLEVEEGG